MRSKDRNQRSELGAGSCLAAGCGIVILDLAVLAAAIVVIIVVLRALGVIG